MKSIKVTGSHPALRKRVLLVGEHPYSWTGNGHFMAEVIKAIDKTKYDVCVIACTGGVNVDPFVKRDVTIIEAGMDRKDPMGAMTVLTALEGTQFDLVFFVGLDIWIYRHIHNEIAKLRDTRGFLWAWWFPMDTWELYPDWLKLMEAVDFPIVYSQYGYNKIHPSLERIRYMRPPIPFEKEKFVRLSAEDREFVRRRVFPGLKKDAFIFGFVGANQIRKDPQRLIKAFFEAKKKLPNAVLYMHTERHGYYDLEQYVKGCGAEPGDVYFKLPGTPYTTEALVELFNCMDCYVMPSMQEGLSVTIVEAWACGIPVIATDTTSQSDLLDRGAIPVPVTDIAYIPIPKDDGGLVWHDAKAANFPALVDAMVAMGRSKKVREELIKEGLEQYEKWIAGIHDVNAFLEEAMESVQKSRSSREARNKVIPRVLFAQHSSAGDVLMTTRCLKGVSERFKGIPLDYMTSPQYMDIVTGNPYVDKVIPWDPELLKRYKHVINPHGERILPGHWGRNSNSLLADFYWKILRVEPTKESIQLQCPEKLKQETINMIAETPFVAVHTTGGDPEYRTYKYMADVCAGLHQRGYLTVQLGGEKDYPAGASLDLRGLLSYRETAWVMDEAAYAITVDSFVSHLAGFLDIPQVCLFGSGNANVVRPVGDVICMSPDYVTYCRGLGPCSASVRDCPVKCTGVHDPEEVLRQFDSLIHGGPTDAIVFDKILDQEQVDRLRAAIDETYKGRKGE